MVGEVKADTPDYNDRKEPLQIKVTLNFGIFFDGTNNNKVQSMIAISNRRKKFFKKYKEQLEAVKAEKKYTDDSQITKSDLEKTGIPLHEIDNVYGASDNIVLDVEKKIASDNKTEFQYSTAAEKYDGSNTTKIPLIGRIQNFFVDKARREKLSQMAGNTPDKFIIIKDLFSISSSKGSGYTNVALLDSLYYTTTDPKPKKKEGRSQSESSDNSEDGDLELYYSIYVEGSGANEEINVIKQLIAYKDSIIGLGFGVDDYGVTKKCRKAIDQVMKIYNKYLYRSDVSKIDCHFDIFGFSRGSTTARLFTYLLNPKKNENYVDYTILERVCGDGQFLLKNREIDFKLSPIGEYLQNQFFGSLDKQENPEDAFSSDNILTQTINEQTSLCPYDDLPDHPSSSLDKDKGSSDDSDFNTEVLSLKSLDFLKEVSSVNGIVDRLKSYEAKLGTKNVRVLGIFDTVASIGVHRDSSSYILGDKFLNIGNSGDLVTTSSIFHDTNVDDFGLYSTDQADEVLHICALDEYRKNFALVDIDSSINFNGTEIYLPGCHTDVGGGASIGLDDFKIINYDDIASKGELIYNLYNRITGLNKLIKNISSIVKNVGVVASTTMTVVSIINAYSSIRSIIYNICDATDNFFSLMTGFESVAEYKAYVGEEVQKHDKPLSGDFSYIQTCNSLVNTSRGLPKESANVISSTTHFIDTVTTSPLNIREDISATKDLVESVIKLTKSIKTIKNSLIKLMSDIRNCKEVVIKEFEDLQNLIDRLTVTDDKIRLIFDPQRVCLKLQIEQRRVCMYMGHPYNTAFQSSSAEQSRIKPICKETLLELGWISKNKSDQKSEDKEKVTTLILEDADDRTWTTGRPTKDAIKTAKKERKTILTEKTRVAHYFQRDNIGICKYSKPGYPYVALTAMYEWATEKGCRFKKESKIDKLYPIPEELKNFYTKDVKPKYNIKDRVFCIPTSPNYRYLRANYLHLSMNQQLLGLADNGLVNGPSFISVSSNLTDEQRLKLIESKLMANKNISYKIDNVISRRIYKGRKGINTQTSNPENFFGGPQTQFWYLGDFSVTKKF